MTTSSSELADEMVARAEIKPGHTLVEVGAGTGVITQVLLQITPIALVVEPHPPFVKALRGRFADQPIAEAQARDLPTLLEPRSVDRVVSSLPWAGWRTEDQLRELSGILAVMKPSGVLVTFSYVHSVILPGFRRFEEVLSERFEEVERSEVAWRNLPPAFVLTARRPVVPTS